MACLSMPLMSSVFIVMLIVVIIVMWLLFIDIWFCTHVVVKLIVFLVVFIVVLSILLLCVKGTSFCLLIFFVIILKINVLKLCLLQISIKILFLLLWFFFFLPIIRRSFMFPLFFIIFVRFVTFLFFVIMGILLFCGVEIIIIILFLHFFLFFPFFMKLAFEIIPCLSLFLAQSVSFFFWGDFGQILKPFNLFLRFILSKWKFPVNWWWLFLLLFLLFNFFVFLFLKILCWLLIRHFSFQIRKFFDNLWTFCMPLPKFWKSAFLWLYNICLLFLQFFLLLVFNWGLSCRFILWTNLVFWNT